MSHNEKSGIVWSLLSWGAAIVIAIVVGWIATRIFGGRVGGPRLRRHRLHGRGLDR